MPNTAFSTPISYHIFNRPEITKKSFAVIKQIKPSILFITADGPRENVKQDIKLCQETRKIVENIDWNCKVYRNYSETNKGSFLSTSNGITWVFSQVERAIILEDDCIPEVSFFQFCQELLEYYKNDQRVSIISGNNFKSNTHFFKNSYSFSRYTYIWGWATWRRTWETVDFSMSNWIEFKNKKGLEGILTKKREQKYWMKIFDKMYYSNKKHWDYLLLLTSFMNHTLSIMPDSHLVKNIGYGETSTNVKKESTLQKIETSDILFPLEHPKFIRREKIVDDYVEKVHFSKTFYTHFYELITSKIKRTFKSL